MARDCNHTHYSELEFNELMLMQLQTLIDQLASKVRNIARLPNLTQIKPADGGGIGNQSFGKYSGNDLIKAIPTENSLTDRWDREWLVYFSSENQQPFFLQHEKLSICSVLRGKTAKEVWQMSLTELKGVGPLPALNIWIERSRHKQLLDHPARGK